MVRMFFVACTFAVLWGCEEDNPCDRYADYICTCHADDEAFDCAALRELTVDPTQSTADACANDLFDQQTQDEEAGLVCEVP